MSPAPLFPGPLSWLDGVFRAISTVVQKLSRGAFVFIVAIAIIMLAGLVATGNADAFFLVFLGVLAGLAVLALIIDVIYTLRHKAKSPSPTAPLPPASPPVEPPPAVRPAVAPVPFVNRDEEKKQLLERRTAMLNVLADGPVGCGKSQLLFEVHGQFPSREFYSVYLKIPADKTAYQIVVDLMAALGTGGAPVVGGTLGQSLGDSMLRAWERDENHGKAGMALVLDLDGNPEPAVVQELVENILPDTLEALRTHHDFKSNHRGFKLILGGRNLIQLVRGFRKAPPFTQMPLSLFDSTAVSQTVDLRLPNYASADRNEIGAHLLFITGGHPGCMAAIINQLERIRLTPARMVEQFPVYWRNWVEPGAADAHRQFLDHDPRLNPYMDLIAVMRCFDLSICDHIFLGKQSPAAAPPPASFRDGIDLNSSLKKSGMFGSIREGLIGDGISRRLLAIRLWNQFPLEIEPACAKAEDFAAQRLCNPRAQHRMSWLLESWFQCLQAKAAQIQSPAVRTELRRRFFEETVPHRLHQFLTCGENEENPEARLEDVVEQLEKDWELNFAVNYYLRGDHFDQDPFERLKKTVLAYRLLPTASVSHGAPLNPHPNTVP